MVHLRFVLQRRLFFWRDIFALVFSILLFGILGMVAHAQVEGVVNDGVPDGGVQISPIRFEADLRPGDVWNATLKLKNFSQEDQELTFSAENFIVTDDTRNITFYPSDEARHRQVPDITDWVRIPKRSVVLPANGTMDVPFSIHIPEDAPTGGYYGAFFVTQSSDGYYNAEEGKARIGINSRMGALLIFAVHGSEAAHIDGSISAFAPVKKVFFSSPAVFRASIRNGGNIHFRGSGVITIARGGKTVNTLPLYSQVNYPHKVRTYETLWHFGLLNIGPYSATLRYESKSELVQLEQTQTFWVVPWSVLVIFFGLLLMIFSVRHYLKKNYTIVRKS